MLYYHPEKKIKLDTTKHADLTPEDLKNQGYEPFTTEYIKKDGKYIKLMKTPSGYEEATPMPLGYIPPGISPDIRSALGEKSEKVVDSTKPLRDEEKVADRNMQEILTNLGQFDTSDLFATDSFYNTNEITNAKNEIDKMQQEIERLSQAEKILNTDDLKEIEQAGVQAGLQFDPLIQKAIEAKKAGLPKAVITAGERGGFMNTQFAGVAALQPIQGGDFLGVGGQLEKIKSGYDQVILNLEAQKKAAIQAAKIAAKQALLTRKKQDTDRAIQLYDIARQRYQDALDAVNNKVNMVQKLMDIKKTQEQMERDKIDWGIQHEQALIELDNARHLTEKLQREYENDLALNGYRKIKSPNELKKYTEDDIVRLYNPLTGNEDVWLKPKEEIKEDGTVVDASSILKDWIEKYPDAGITLNDDLITARNKLMNSNIFKEEHKLPDTNKANVDQIAKAIKLIESGGDYNARGESGEFGAYQFMPDTWSAWSGEYTTAMNGVPQTLDPTPENQDKVAKWKIQQLLNKGYTPEQIASIWNSGSPDWEGKIGINQAGVQYNVPDYVRKFRQALLNVLETEQSGTEQEAIDEGVADKSILHAAGLSYPAFLALTGQLSKLPRDKESRTKAMEEAKEFASRMGVDVSTLASEYDAYYDVLKKNIQRANQTKIFAGEVIGTANQFIEEVGDDFTNLKPANVLKFLLGEQVNDPIVQKYAFALQTLRNDLAGYYAAARGDNLPTEEDNKVAAYVIKNGLSKRSVQAFRDSIQLNNEKIMNVVDKAVEDARQKVWELFGVGDKYKSQNVNQKPRLQDPEGNIYEYDSKNDPDYINDLKSGWKPINY